MLVKSAERELCEVIAIHGNVDWVARALVFPNWMCLYFSSDDVWSHVVLPPKLPLRTQTELNVQLTDTWAATIDSTYSTSQRRCDKFPDKYLKVLHKFITKLE